MVSEDPEVLAKRLPLPADLPAQQAWVERLRKAGHPYPERALALRLYAAHRVKEALAWILDAIAAGDTAAKAFHDVWFEAHYREWPDEPPEQPRVHSSSDSALGSPLKPGNISRGGEMRPVAAHPAEPRQPQRFLQADLPSHAPLDADISLVVQITGHPASWARKSARLDRLKVPSGGQAVTVIVQAPEGLPPGDGLEQVILVPPDGDPEPVRFWFHARSPGSHRLHITTWAGGTFLAELEVEVSVEAGGAFGVQRGAIAVLGEPRARPGEVTLLVRSDGTRYVFQLLSDEYLFEPVHARTLTADPGVAVERAITTLKQLAEGRGPYAGKAAQRWIRETGVGLWNDVVPAVIKEQYWQLRPNIAALTVATTHDILPWELLYPLRPGLDDGFLVEQFPVLRRVFGARRVRKIGLGGAYVVSSRVPANARQEIDAIADVIGTGAVIDDLETLLDLIGSGTCGSLHFACHNDFSPVAGSSIRLNGGPFVPGLLNSAATEKTLAARSPLVFLNACRSAGAVPEFTRMMGWAQQFMAAGAGAFVGTLWPVRSETAADFAQRFYSGLWEGRTLGEAAHHARRTTTRDHLDPTWLAYTVYGDPSAVA